MEKAAKEAVAPEEAPAKKKNEGAPSTLISARVFECYSPPPTNTFKGAMVPRVFNIHRRRRKIAIEVHRVDGVEECIVRVLDPATKADRIAAKKRAIEKLKKLGQSAPVVDEEDDEASVGSMSTADGVPVEFRDAGSPSYDEKGWVAKYRFPVRTLSIKGTQKTGVFVQIDLGKRKQIRELIFDSVQESESFQTVIWRELEKESSRAKAKVAAAVGDDASAMSDEKVTFLIEIVSAWNIPAGDFFSSDPFVICRLNQREVHRTKYISKTLDPIWTLKTDSLFLLTVSLDELFVGEGLVCTLYDFDNLGKNEKLGMITVPPKVLYDAKGERLEFKLEPPPNSKEKEVPGWMAIRCRRADDYDKNFMEEYYSGSGQMKLGFVGGKARIAAMQKIAKAKGGSGNIKSMITRKTRIAREGSNVGKKQYKVRPNPDPARPEETVWLTKAEIEAESQLPSRNWVDSGSGSLGRIFLEIIGCDELPNLDTGGFAGNKTDTFVCVVYEDTVLRTDVIDDCLSPRWMPWCQRAFILHMLHSSSQLFLGVFDYDQGLNPTDDHDLIGRVSIDLSNLRRNTTYNLKYTIYPTAKMSNRKQQGSITIRVRIETEDERKLLLSNLEPPPAIYVNAKSRRDFRMIRYTVTGRYDMDRYNMKTINAYIEELLASQHAMFYIEDGIISLLLWRNNFAINVGKDKPILLPLHSLAAFIIAIFLVEKPHLVPSFCFGCIGWILLSINGFRRNLPDLWSRCKSFQEFIEALVFGVSFAPPHSIEPLENKEEAEKFVKAWQKRIADAEADAARAYEESVRQQEEYQKEMEDLGDEDTDIATRKDGVSVDPFKPILFPLQQHLALVCRYVRHVKHVISWEECYIAFWITLGCFLLSFVCCFVPWFFLIKWTSRIVVWVIFGPWMKFVDIFYWSKIKPLNEEEKLEKVKKEREQRRLEMTTTLSATRLKREKAEKLKAMKKYLFGKFIIRVPVLKEDRYRDLPLGESSAVPYSPDKRPLAELAMEDVGYHKTRVPGQHLEGEMIPKVVTQNFTDAPTGQATAHPELLGNGAPNTRPESTEAAYATIASVIVAAGILTSVGVPLLGAAIEYALNKSV